MDEQIKFSSIKELYDRVKPALYSKQKELHRMGFKYVTEKDIWNYLIENVWTNKTDLELYELISDIMHVDNITINEYVMNKMKSYKEKEETVEVDKEGLF